MYGDKLEELRKQHEEEMNALSEKHTTELEKVRRQYEDEYTEKLNEMYGAEIEKLRRQHEKALSRKDDEILRLNKKNISLLRKTIIAAVGALLTGIILMFCMTRFVFKWVPTDTDSEDLLETVETSPSPTPITLPEIDLEAFCLYPNDGEIVNVGSELETEPVGDVLFASGEPAEQLRTLISEAESAGARITVIKGFEPYNEEQPTEENRLLATGFVAELSAVSDENGETEKEFPVDFSVEPHNWLMENAFRFGFIEIKDWTFRYVGKEAAFYIGETGISLEEFISLSIAEFRMPQQK